MPFHQYFNGEILPIDSPIFKTNDLGLLRGFGLFDYFRTYNGVPFRWNDYWQRFENSARLLKLTLPVTQQITEKVLADLHAMSGEQEVAFRFVLTGGYAPDSVHVVQPNFLIRTEPLPQDNPAGRLKGIKVLPYDYVRDLPEVKTTNYVHMVLMADELRRQQAADLLFHKDGEISELTRSNIFIFHGDKLITSDRNILKGITRKVVMELAKPHFEVEIRPVLYKEVILADEVFTTSTTKWVMPVVQIGDLPVGSGEAGKRTLLLQQLFEKLVTDWGK
ncbi:aminotransferase class IV [Dyadobacter fanqingshengii]|uniref:branched-chain-amino-acid transaminase n=1 Tax=Dyadobacter fanqingshengii TaxID=2906443 RepID=A0A9X1PDA5_9BACT|nr:aminotransferase class IV [Dyadobacter fanqingshengii]MCF0042385.1 aminotransferase class IV [Dyadobacter fanqingshengii]USJ35089.1 aminotransferase class IV [Dyadobacter fanqingshengii]